MRNSATQNSRRQIEDLKTVSVEMVCSPKSENYISTPFRLDTRGDISFPGEMSLTTQFEQLKRRAPSLFPTQPISMRPCDSRVGDTRGNSSQAHSAKHSTSRSMPKARNILEPDDNSSTLDILQFRLFLQRRHSTNWKLKICHDVFKDAPRRKRSFSQTHTWNLNSPIEFVQKLRLDEHNGVHCQIVINKEFPRFVPATIILRYSFES